MANKRHKIQHNFRPFGEAFKKARERLGLKPEEAANVLDTSVEHLEGIESKGRKPSRDLLLSMMFLYYPVINFNELLHFIKSGETPEESSSRHMLKTFADSSDNEICSLLLDFGCSVKTWMIKNHKENHIDDETEMP